MLDAEVAHQFRQHPDRAWKAARALCLAAGCLDLVGCPDAKRDFIRRAVEVLEVCSQRKDTWAGA